MKEKQPFRKLLIWTLTLVVVLVFGLNTIKRISFVQSVDRNFFSFFSMIRYSIIDYPITSLTNTASDFSNFWDTRYETDRLREQLSAYAIQSAKIKELEEEVVSLKALNNLESVYSDYTLISGKVVSRAWDTWNQVVTIDIGENKGVAVDDAVVSAHGMVGRVVDVFANTATVRLLTANDELSQSSVKIRVNDSIQIQGILRYYNAETRLFEVQLMDSSATIQADMQVSTSGLGGVFPSGLVVGIVDSVKPVADSVGIVAYIKSNVDFNDLDYIKVVKKP